MPGELDGAVDSLTGPNPGQRMQRGEAFTARGDSPAPQQTNYHLDQPIEARAPFVPSVIQDGGLAVLHSPDTRTVNKDVMLAADQSDLKGTVTMRPRAVDMHRGDGPAKKGTGRRVDPEEVGLALRPITIQRQADVDDMGVPLDSEGIRPKTFISDGTSAGGHKIDTTRVLTIEDAEEHVKTAAVASSSLVSEGSTAAPQTLQPAQRLTPVTETAPMPQAKPRQTHKVVFIPPGGGKIRAVVNDVILGERVLILVYDADSETSYEPPEASSDTPLKIQIGDKTLSCLYSDWSVEKDGALYLVFIILGEAR